MRALLRVSRVVLAVCVLLIAGITFSNLPQPYPTWPTVGPIPVNPELVVPGLLGFVAILEALREGVTMDSIVIGMFGVVTLWLAATSLYTLYGSTSGGVFWGGFFTLISGIILAHGVIVQHVLRQSYPREIIFRIHEQFGE